MERRTGRFLARRTLGLALGAGGARGMAHVGVLKGLSEAGIRVDAIAGTSIGALVGAVYAAGQLENFEQRIRSLELADVVRLFDPVWPRSGLLSGGRAVEFLTGVLGTWRIEDLPIPFAAVSVDLVTGEEVLIRSGRVIDAVRASISIPGIFVPHRSGNRVLVDGALRNPVPVSALEELGADVRVAVNLHHVPVREISRPSRATAGGSRSRPRIRTRVSEALERGLSRLRRGSRTSSSPAEEVEDEAAPNLLEILAASMSVLEYELARHRLRHDPVHVVIEPDVHGIRTFEFQKARQAIAAGLRDVAPHIPEIQRRVSRRSLRR
jgi:NTE family protein